MTETLNDFLWDWKNDIWSYKQARAYTRRINKQWSKKSKLNTWSSMAILSYPDTYSWPDIYNMYVSEVGDKNHALAKQLMKLKGQQITKYWGMVKNDTKNY